jgi:hydrogenase/urease accessory protein HupE
MRPLGCALRRWAVVFAAAAAALAGAAAQAHDARPLSVGVIEQTPDVYRVVVRAPPTLQAGNAPQIVWPDACEVQESTPLSFDVGGVSLIACPGGLSGLPIEIVYPVYNPSITTLFRLEPLEGATRTAVLPPDQLVWTVPEEPNWRTVARDYIALGVTHIWGGPDHLMFVAGLILLARRPKRILLAVTGFTAAHSITLSLATLNLVHLPVPPVEAMIALSILFLAGELARKHSHTFSHRFPIALSFTFGLLHGFGFASALAEVGLPTSELAVGLVCFNVGVEIGQLTFIACIGALVLAWREGGARLAPPEWGRVLEARIGIVGAYVLGVPAAFWFFQRASLALAG